MAGSSMAFTYDRGPGPIVRVVADWVSDDADGTVSGTTTVKVSGRVIKAITNPGAAAPDANYDIAITGEESVDVLGNVQTGLGNRHTSTTEETYFLVKDAAPLAQSIHPVVCSELTVAVSNAGNSKAGKLVLFIEGQLSGSF